MPFGLDSGLVLGCVLAVVRAACLILLRRERGVTDFQAISATLNPEVLFLLSTSNRPLLKTIAMPISPIPPSACKPELIPY